MRPIWFAACWIGVCLALIYLPDCGVGFIKDDYGRIASSRLEGWHSVWQTFTTSPSGFYRPFGEALPIALNLFLPDHAPSEVVVSTEPPPSRAPASDTVEFVLSGTTLVERRVP